VLIIVFSIIPILIINVIVVKPLREGVKLATSIADKDLSLFISSKSEDEIGSIINSIEEAKNNLKDIVAETQLSSTEVTSASEVLQLSLNSIIDKTQHMTLFVENMNKNIQENIYTIKETNTEIKEIVTNSNKTKEISIEVSNYAKDVNQSAVIGRNSIQEIIHTIGEIDNSSRNVTDYIEEINTISNELENMAINLTVLVNEFKIY